MKSALFWLIAFAISSLGFACAGVYVIYGPVAAMIVASLYSAIFALITFRGMGNG